MKTSIHIQSASFRMLKIILILTSLAIGCNSQEQDKKKAWGIVGNPLAHYRPCNNSDKVSVVFEAGLPPGEENQYTLIVSESLPKNTRAKLMFDSEASVTLTDPETARISAIGDTFHVNFFKNAPALSVKVRGPATGTIPYVTGIIINTVNYCEHLKKTGYLDDLIVGYKSSASVSQNTTDQSCGRRKVDYTELIVSGQSTKPGDWPWHVALYRLDGASLNYICGGTLLSKTLVLTAGHCVTIRGIPVSTGVLNVVLGKYNLIGGDISAQEREVHEIIVHESFDFKLLNNDIAMLKLKSEAVFNDYIQPACLWDMNAYKRLPEGKIIGTVVGWGFDQTDKLTAQLQQANIPKVSEATCLRNNPVFFAKMLTQQKFCAGYTNGTSACNGDSGGGFVVFIPDTSGEASGKASGAWHLRGVVSSSAARRDAPVCDPTSYVLFTDVAKFRGWVTRVLSKK